jgi:hypothetical protein
MDNNKLKFEILKEEMVMKIIVRVSVTFNKSPIPFRGER